MFLQKLTIDQQTSYETSESIENIIENMKLSHRHIPVITLYTSKALSKAAIEEQLSAEKSAITLTIPQYSEYKDRFDSTHVIVPEFELLAEFGYNQEDIDRPVIAMGKHGLAKLPLCKFYINAEKNDRFVCIYLLSQIYSVTIFTKVPNRAKIFAKIFDLECKVYSYEDEVEEVETECAIFLDGCHVDVECEREFVIGRKYQDYEKLSLDLSLAGKFKYRVLDVMKRVSPGVARHIDKFDYSMFKGITN